MESENTFAVFITLVISLLVCILMWPRKKPSSQYYIDVLDYSVWKNYDVIYREVFKRSKGGISENEHDHMLQELEASGVIEARPLELEIAEEIIALNEMGRSHVDQIGRYTTLLMHEYRLIRNDGDGGRPIRKHKEIFSTLNLSSSYT